MSENANDNEKVVIFDKKRDATLGQLGYAIAETTAEYEELMLNSEADVAIVHFDDFTSEDRDQMLSSQNQAGKDIIYFGVLHGEEQNTEDDEIISMCEPSLTFATCFSKKLNREQVEHLIRFHKKRRAYENDIDGVAATDATGGAAAPPKKNNRVIATIVLPLVAGLGVVGYVINDSGDENGQLPLQKRAATVTSDSSTAETPGNIDPEVQPSAGMAVDTTQGASRVDQYLIAQAALRVQKEKEAAEKAEAERREAERREAERREAERREAARREAARREAARREAARRAAEEAERERRRRAAQRNDSEVERDSSSSESLVARRIDSDRGTSRNSGGSTSSSQTMELAKLDTSTSQRNGAPTPDKLPELSQGGQYLLDQYKTKAFIKMQQRLYVPVESESALYYLNKMQELAGENNDVLRLANNIVKNILDNGRDAIRRGNLQSLRKATSDLEQVSLFFSDVIPVIQSRNSYRSLIKRYEESITKSVVSMPKDFMPEQGEIFNVAVGNFKDVLNTL